MAEDAGPLIRTGIILDTSGTKVGADEAVQAIRAVGAEAEATQAKVTASTGAMGSSYDRFAERQRQQALAFQEYYNAANQQARAAAQGFALTNEQAQMMATRVQAISQAFQSSNFAGFGLEIGKVGQAAQLAMPEIQAMAIAEDAARTAIAAAAAGAGAASGFFQQLGGSTHAGSLGMSYLRRELLSVAASATGTNPILARLGFTLSALQGYGTVAITALTAVAAAMLLIEGGVAIWKHFHEAQIENQQAADAFTKTDQGLAAALRGELVARQALIGTTGQGTVVLTGATTALEKSRKEIAGLTQDLEAASSVWGRLKTGFAAFAMQGDTHDRGQFLQFRSALADLKYQYAHGKLSLDQYDNSLGLLAQAFKKLDIGPNILQAAEWGQQLKAATDAQTVLIAQQQHQQAIAAENGSAGLTDRLLSGQRLAIARAQGKSGVQAFDDEQQAIQNATKAWDGYTTSMAGAQYANLTLREALAQKNAEAEREVADALAVIQNTRAVTKTLDDQKASLDQLAATRQAQEKAQENVAQMRVELDQRTRMTAAIKQGQDAVDHLTVALAGENAERQFGATLHGQALQDAVALAEANAQATINQRKATEATQAYTKASHAADTADQARAKHQAELARAVAENEVQQARELAQAMVNPFTQFMGTVLTTGKDVWKTLMQDLERGFLQLIERLTAAKLMNKILAGGIAGSMALATTAGAQVPTGVAGINVPLMPTAPLSTTMGSASIGLGGLGIGYSVGSQTTNTALGAFGGAASGAAAGAMMGSVIPGIGTAVGAVVGGVTGLVGGLFGSAAKARQAAREMQQAQEQFQTALASMVATVKGDTLGQAIAQVQSQFDQLRKQAEDAYKGRANESARNQALAQLNGLEATRIQQLKDEAAFQQTQFNASLTVRQLQLQNDQQGAAVAQLLAQQEQELADARKRGYDAASLLTLQEIQQQELDRLKAQQLQAAQAATDALTVRMLTARGQTTQAAALQRQLDEAKEYNDAVQQGMSAQYLAALKFTQAAEDARTAADAAAQAQAKALQQQRDLEDLKVRDLVATGNQGAADDLAFQEKQRREYQDAVTAGRSAAYLAQLKQTLADEAAQRANQAQAATMQAAQQAKASATSSTTYGALASASSGQFDVGLGLWKSMDAHLFNIDHATRTFSTGAAPSSIAAAASAARGSGDTFIIQVQIDDASPVTPGQQVGRQIDQVLGKRQSALRAAVGVPRRVN